MRFSQPFKFLGTCALVSALFVGAHAHGQATVGFTFNGTETNGRFGYSVDAAGDVNNDGIPDVIVGAYQESSGGVERGAARVYSGADGSLIHVLSGGQDEAEYGIEVAGAGDINNDGFDDFIVTALKEHANGWSDNGVVRVYSGFDSSVIYEFAGPSSNRQIGRSIGGLGDVNNDGIDDFFVSAHRALIDADRSGRLDVHSGADGSVIYSLVSPIATGEFGFAADNAGDVNGDGVNDCVVGAYRGSHANGQDAGLAFVFDGATGTLIYTFQGEDVNDRFGGSVAGAGDVNNDGFDDVIVGAFLDDNSGSNTGSAFVFSGADGSQLYVFDGPVLTRQFGRSVDGAGDFNGDGYDDVIVGAPLDIAKSRVFSGRDGSLLEDLADNAPQSVYFGFSNKGIGDINGDGFDDVVVGSWLGDIGATDAGEAFVFLAPVQQTLTYDSQTPGAVSELFTEWIPDGGDPTSVTGTVMCTGATPGGAGLSVASFGMADFLYLGFLPILVDPNPVNLISQAEFGFGFAGELIVNGVSRQNPLLAGLFVHVQNFETSPVIRASNAIRFELVP